MTRLTAAAVLALVTGFAPWARPPIPPAPRLTEHRLVGEWDLWWATNRDARIAFYADGTFHARYDPESVWCHTGPWWIERDGTLVLMESWLDARTGTIQAGPNRVALKLAPATLAGTGPNGIAVRLLNPKR